MSYTQFVSTATLTLCDDFNVQSYLDAIAERCVKEKNFLFEEYGEIDGKEEAEYDNENGESDNTSILGGAGTPVTDVGITYYTNQVAPALILGGTAGR